MAKTYTVKVFGPNGEIAIQESTHEEAIDTASNLLEASNGYHDVKIVKEAV
jgi:hypothetical protein